MGNKKPAYPDSFIENGGSFTTGKKQSIATVLVQDTVLLKKIIGITDRIVTLFYKIPTKKLS